jgi:predicted RNase H-like HicB family nuclease
MKIKVVVHEAEEGGYWAEVPAIPGCATQGETMEELLRNVREAIEGCLSVDIAEPKPDENLRILEIAVRSHCPAATSLDLSSAAAGDCSGSTEAITSTEETAPWCDFPFLCMGILH